MPFGTVHRSWPNPVDNGDIGRGMTWMGDGLGVYDGKNTRLHIFQVGSQLVELARYTTPPGVLGIPQGPKLWGAHLLARTGAGQIHAQAFPAMTSRLLLSPTSRDPFGVDVSDGVMYVLVASATLTRYQAGPDGTWTLVNSKPAANPYYTWFAGLVIQGPYVYTVASDNLLVKSDLATWTVVATAAAPATGPALGMCTNGANLYINLGGSTDRIYEVALG